MRRLFFSILAGFGATSVHLALMALKRSAGVLPEFDPYEDLQRLLSAATAGSFQPPSWLLAYLNGALILGFVFGRIFPYLPGRSALARGAAFGFAAWLCLGLGLLPLAGRGIFGIDLNLGFSPAALMLAMVMIYAITMSLLYGWLMTESAENERGAA